MSRTKILGPFTQILTMRSLPLKGPIDDEKLEIIPNCGLLIHEFKIHDVGNYDHLHKEHPNATLIEVEPDTVALPGFIDPHTHICYAGSRANDYAMRIAGKSYLEIAKEGGGIWQTVQNTRKASPKILIDGIVARGNKMLSAGITTCEVKSGYGLTIDEEIKMLEAINAANNRILLDLIPTCLAAHMLPRDFEGSEPEYLQLLIDMLLPEVKKKNLANRIDIFIEESAFNSNDALNYLEEAKTSGFDITIHGDQFTTSGSSLATKVGAISVDHLEASTRKEIEALAKSNVIATVLPGASIGLGMHFAPARKMLDAGCTLAIGSDWNPGSAPMGDLLVQASILGASEKLTNAETIAGITCRSARALNLHQQGSLEPNFRADLVGFPCNDYREILYNQGMLRPSIVVKNGVTVH